jgi:hypothetical protein
MSSVNAHTKLLSSKEGQAIHSSQVAARVFNPHTLALPISRVRAQEQTRGACHCEMSSGCGDRVLVSVQGTCVHPHRHCNSCELRERGLHGGWWGLAVAQEEGLVETDYPQAPCYSHPSACH